MSMLKRKPRVEPDGLKSAVVQEANRHLERAHAENSSLQERLDRATAEIARRRAADDEAEDRRQAINNILNHVPGLSQSHGDDQAADVHELAERCRAAEAAKARLQDRRAVLIAEIADLKVQAAEAVKVPAGAVAPLERLARPGTINPTERRKLAGEALEALGVTGDAEAAQ